jgi:hypothetical protein
MQPATSSAVHAFGSWMYFEHHKPYRAARMKDLETDQYIPATSLRTFGPFSTSNTTLKRQQPGVRRRSRQARPDGARDDN